LLCELNEFGHYLAAPLKHCRIVNRIRETFHLMRKHTFHPRQKFWVLPDSLRQSFDDV
jgi:hypothetical protein